MSSVIFLVGEKLRCEMFYSWNNTIKNYKVFWGFFFVLRKNTQENMVISDHYIIITENNSVV